MTDIEKVLQDLERAKDLIAGAWSLIPNCHYSLLDDAICNITKAQFEIEQDYLR